MIDSTLCYLEKNGEYLMLHRTKKEVDCNKGKWIGVGGKREYPETVAECLVREVREETGLILRSFEPRAIIEFHSDLWESERMFLFTSDDFGGDPDISAFNCTEGELAWIGKEDIMGLNLWEGDRIFMEKLLNGERFFFMRLNYIGDELADWSVGGQNFKERVYEETARVPRGRVSTYGEIAALTGHPGAARAVGNALHDNPYEGVIPCHRIVSASGRPAPNFAFGGAEAQLRLLRAEGAAVRNGRVVLTGDI